MPYFSRRIMKLNPDNDSLSNVGDDPGQGGYKYSGTVVGNDDCLYSIVPDEATRIAKFDPANPDTTCTAVGDEAGEWFVCNNGVLGGDGDVYAANRYNMVKYCRLIQQAVTTPGLGIEY